MWESRVLRRAFERLELHEGKLSRAVLRGGGGGDVTSLPDPQGSNPLGPPGPELCKQLGMVPPELLEREKDFELADRIKRISPVSWKHVNFCGEYSPVIL